MGKISFERKIGKFSRVALDSVIFIYQFGQHAKFYPQTHYVFSLLDKKKLKIITSIIALIETISFSELETKPELIKAYKDFFMKTKNLETIIPNLRIADETALLRRKYHLRTPDAIQLATAIVNQVEIFITNDDRFRQVKDFPILLLKDFS